MYNFLNLSEYVSYISSDTIHILGISPGDTVYLHYRWDEIEEMFKDRLKNKTKFLEVKDLELIEIELEGYVPPIEDIIGNIEEII